MQRLQAYKYELMPDGQQKRSMSRFAGSCRFVYNKALALQKELYEADKETLINSSIRLMRALTADKPLACQRSDAGAMHPSGQRPAMQTCIPA